MNPFLLLLFQAGVNIAGAHVKNKTAVEGLSTINFILDAAQALDDLHREETGEPLDWSKIREHQPLAPSGEAPTHLPSPGEESPDVPSSTGPETEQPIEEIAEPGEGEAAEADAAAGPEDPPAE